MYLIDGWVDGFNVIVYLPHTTGNILYMYIANVMTSFNPSIH